MSRTKQSDPDWRDRQQDLRAWLAGSAAERALSEQGMRERQQHAARSLWGWLPLAVLIFWATYILTKYISFSGDGSAMPEYDVSVAGSASDPIVADIGGKANAITIRFFIPQGVRSLSIGSVAPGEACSQPNGEDSVPIRSGIWYDDTPFTDPGDGQTVTGRRVQIDPAKQLRYGPMPLYGRTVQVAELTCRTLWQPQRTSFAAYRMRINNLNPGPVRGAPNHTEPLLALMAAAPYLDEARLVTLAGQPSLSSDERNVVPDDFVALTWKPLDEAQFRDVMLIVIGALIGFGAAIVIEALRAHIQIAIDSGRRAVDAEKPP
jgi:hypothetical protein